MCMYMCTYNMYVCIHTHTHTHTHSLTLSLSLSLSLTHTHTHLAEALYVCVEDVGCANALVLQFVNAAVTSVRNLACSICTFVLVKYQ
jgi:hypothetical protein